MAHAELLGSGSRTMQLIELFTEQSWRFLRLAFETEFSAALDEGIAKYRVQINDVAFDKLLKLLPQRLSCLTALLLKNSSAAAWPNCPNAARVLDTIDLHGLRNAR
jgi:O-antigen biosynthesis protein